MTRVTFCEKGGTVQRVTDFFIKIGTSVTCSDVELTPNFNTKNLKGAFTLKEKFHDETFLESE